MIRPERNLSSSIPMPENVYRRLFPDSEKQPELDQEGLGYHRTQTLYKEKYLTVEGPLEELFGKEWYLTHVSQNVGVIYGKISFNFKKKTLLQYQHIIQAANMNTLNPDSLKEESQTYLVVNYLFTNICRRQPFLNPPRETTYWTKLVRDILRKNHQNTQVVGVSKQ